MKKAVSLILLMVLTTNCISYKVNLAFSLMGIYDDKVEISKLTNNNKELLFIPMHHIGTKSFYTDVTKKVDSLENLGFYFYKEKVTRSQNDSIVLLKLRKITGIPFSKKNTSYTGIFDSIYEGKIKYKKELIDQPTYIGLGVDTLKSRNVDVTMRDLIQYYESKYG